MENDPGWLIFEKGKQLFDSGEYGDAIYYFRKAYEKLGSSPEIEYWIGRVFEAEGEYTLAEKQYETSIDQRKLLLVPDEEIELRTRLAQVCRTLNDFDGYSSGLEAITAYDTARRNEQAVYEIDPLTLTRVLVERGYDKLLELYRIDDYGGLSAYYNLGIYKYRTGFYAASIQQLTFAFVITNTTVINYMIDRDPEYRFATLPDLLFDALRFPRVFDYLYTVDAFGQAYALGTALYATGEVTKQAVAKELWRIIIEYDENGWWTAKARRQLQSPFDDDFMIIFPE